MRVVAAVIIDGKSVFAAQRGGSGPLRGKWEFPGGKVKEGEEPAVALAREIVEELGVTITVEEHFLTVEHSYPTFDITLESYRCTLKSGSFVLHEHLGSGWFTIDQLDALDWAAADLPIVHLLKEVLA